MMIDSIRDPEQVIRVANFRDLIAVRFAGPVNAACWTRSLMGDFSELVDRLPSEGNITVVGPEELRSLELSAQGRLARDLILTDLEALSAYGAAPVLNLIDHYDRDDALPFFSTDVYSFHADRAPIPADTFLCTYYGDPSEIIPNAQAVQKVEIPEIRAQLRELYDGPEDGFEPFLQDHFFDLHYEAKAGARPISLGTGHLWRLAIDHPGSQALPCIHRAPVERSGRRLLLIC